MPIRLTSGYGDRLARDRFGSSSQERTDIIALCAFWNRLQDSNGSSPQLRRNECLRVVQETRAAADRLLTDGVLTGCSFLRPHEIFELGFLVAVLLSCVDAFEASLSKVDTKEKPAKQKSENKEAQAARHLLREKVDNLATIEIVFLIGSDPENYIKPFVQQTGLVAKDVLESKGLNFDIGYNFLSDFQKSAEHSFKVWLSSASQTAKWIAAYLNFEHQKAWSTKVSDDVKSIQQALTNWLQPTSEAAKKRADAWKKYKESLVELPDLKETMFAEQFGVRRVFVQPIARYKVSGMNLQEGAKVPDVANLIAGLISERIAGDELILLCGGPGSGKSTLCRIVASELASNPDMHPVFLRLRRLQDGQDIPTFVESHLQREGIIDKFSDLGEVSNLVLILDGFDELVMASRSRLREFFNTLREDLGSGPLRKAKAIVSGRDTLFPNGAGLPTGSHVISLLPFDKPRIKAWAEKWRALHAPGGKKFQPDIFFDEEATESSTKSPPLHHLVSWPLTLHLVARVHSSGALDLTQAAKQKIEKAALYRSIVFETALRQQEQSAGKGRLTPDQMREFVQAISWEMYSTSRDALDYNEGLPLLKAIYPNASEVELAELADVAIVNQPELTKGEEGGFEFVHKSFSEYFVAEKFARTLEKICFKSVDYDSEHLTWRMSAKEAISETAFLTAIRVITSEVQEMLEPMLADFKTFLRPAPESKERNSELLEKLEIKKSRIEQLIGEYASGGCQTDVVERVRGSRIVTDEREIHANFTVGLLVLGCALSRRLSDARRKGKDDEVRVNGGNLWKLISVIQAGDIPFDATLAKRILDPIRIGSDEEPMEVFYPPIPTRFLHGVRGALFPAEFAVAFALNLIAVMALEGALLKFIPLFSEDKKASELVFRDTRFFRHRRGGRITEAIDQLDRAGILPQRSQWVIDSPVRYMEEQFEDLMDRSFDPRRSKGPRERREDIDRVRDYLRELIYRIERSGDSYIYREFGERTDHLLRSFFALER